MFDYHRSPYFVVSRVYIKGQSKIKVELVFLQHYSLAKRLNMLDPITGMTEFQQ